MFANFLRSNKFALILSLFLAVILWIFVVGESLFQVSPERKTLRNVPLVYVNLTEGLEATLELDEITVSLEGMPGDVKKVEPADLTAFVNLEDKEPGSYQVEIRVNPPKDLDVISYLPAEVEVSIREDDEPDDELEGEA